MNKIVLITGATSGIGKAAAYIFAQNNCDLIITGRRRNKLDEIKKEIEEKYKTQVLALDFDICDSKAVSNAILSLKDKWINIDILINNAGLAVGMNSIQEGILDDWERMIDTNLKGLLYITRLVAALMIDNRKGHIINIGSVAGKEVYPSGNVYCATKFAVDALSKAMRIDLLKHKIKVTQVCPGAVQTEFSVVRFKGDNERAEKVYKGYEPLKPEDVAEVIYYVTTLPPHVNINDLTVTPLSQGNVYVYDREK